MCCMRRVDTVDISQNAEYRSVYMGKHALQCCDTMYDTFSQCIHNTDRFMRKQPI